MKMFTKWCIENQHKLLQTGLKCREKAHRDVEKFTGRVSELFIFLYYLLLSFRDFRFRKIRLGDIRDYQHHCAWAI